MLGILGSFTICSILFVLIISIGLACEKRDKTTQYRKEFNEKWNEKYGHK